MNHKEIIIKWKGKNIDYDGAYGYQCTDWARKYCKERGYPIGFFSGYAWKWWVTGSPFDGSWKRVVKTNLNSPKEGDIIFWSEGRCKYGHVAVANSLCNPLVLRYSDQNGTGKGDKIQNRFSGYQHVVGWFTKNPPKGD